MWHSIIHGGGEGESLGVSAGGCRPQRWFLSSIISRSVVVGSQVAPPSSSFVRACVRPGRAAVASHIHHHLLLGGFGIELIKM